MNKEKIFEFLNKNTVATIATTDGNKPYLRNVWPMETNLAPKEYINLS